MSITPSRQSTHRPPIKKAPGLGRLGGYLPKPKGILLAQARAEVFANDLSKLAVQDDPGQLLPQSHSSSRVWEKGIAIAVPVLGSGLKSFLRHAPITCCILDLRSQVSFCAWATAESQP
jgi:hypothetical protein